MLTFEVTSKQDRVIDGLGVFAAGETRTFSQDEANWYQRVRGVPLTQDNVPNGVKVVIVVNEEVK